MKNINQIFKNNKDLMNNPEVSELIDYCIDLEGKVLDTEIKDSYNKEHILKSSLFDILHGCREFIKEDELSIRFRETPRIDFKTSVENIISFIEKMCEDNNINLLND
jgi:hypothetical protein